MNELIQIYGVCANTAHSPKWQPRQQDVYFAEEGFVRYENGYRKTIERSQAQLFTGLLVPKTSFGIWMRNTLTNLPIMGAMANMERRLAQRKDEALPEYQSV